MEGRRLMNRQTIARVIALALAVILALGCFLTPALAAETAAAGEEAGMPVLPILLSAVFGGGAAVVMMAKNKKK